MAGFPNNRSRKQPCTLSAIIMMFDQRRLVMMSRFSRNAHLFIVHHHMQCIVFADSAGWPGRMGMHTLQSMANAF